MLLTLSALAVAACGGQSRNGAESAADCLNDLGFLVRSSGNAVHGSSPAGVTFTVTLRPTGAAIDDSGNPGKPPRRLSQSDRIAIESCATPS